MDSEQHLIDIGFARIDRAFDAWDGDVAALLGVPRGTFEPETEAVEPTEF